MIPPAIALEPTKLVPRLRVGRFDPDHPHRSPLDWRSTPGELLTPERYGPKEFEAQLPSASPLREGGQVGSRRRLAALAA